MNWEEVSAIGQVLGSIAVFITLGYLAVQTRHGRDDARRALSEGRGQAVRELMRTRVTDPQLNALYGKANVAFGGEPATGFTALLMERAGMTLEEALSLSWDLFAWFTYRIQIIPNVDDLPPMERTSFDNAIRGSVGQPGVYRTFFEDYVRPTQHPDFIRYIDNVLAQPV